MPNWTKEQETAIYESGSNIIVSAGAGSGKTAVLTTRVIEKLKQGIHINELLILTFTNNAAAEMKERILKEIRKYDNLKEEQDLIESSYITTFDAYSLSLVKKYHYLLGIDKDVKIISDKIIKQKKEEILDNIFNKYYQENNTDFINLITKYGIKNDSPIREKILYLNEKLELLVDTKNYLENYIDTYYSNKNIEKLFNKYLNLINTRINFIRNSLDNLSFYCENNYFSKISEVLNPILNATNYEEIKNNANPTLPRIPNGSDEKLKYYKKQISDELKNIKELTTYSEQELKNDLLNTKNDATIIINILKELNETLESEKLINNMFSFNDISKFAIRLVNEFDDVRNTLKNTFKEIMIDEYQDTSDIQEAFISKISNNNVYMVGDIKQSIYRFRNANPNIFKIKYDKYKNNIGGRKIDLNKNFRSREEVLTSINDIFNHIMDDSLGNANYNLEHRLIFGNKTFETLGKTSHSNDLEIYNYEKDETHTKEEIEAFIIGNDIKKKVSEHYQVFDGESLRDITYKDFCILMDRTTYFNIYKKVFDYLNIPLNIYKDENILETDETLLINNILGLIVNIKTNTYDTNKFYYTSIARSYLYNLHDKEIYDVIKNNKLKETDIYLKCKEIAKDIENISNRMIIEKIITEFNFYDRMNYTSNILNRTIILNNLLNTADELNQIGMDYLKMKDYFSYLIDNKNDLKIPAIISDSDMVTITNIHKSKGLEYKICYYSGLYKEFNMMDLKAKILYDNDYGIILPIYDEGFKNTFINTLNKEKNVVDEISEKLRLFYVALTRAKEKMIMVAPLSNNKIYTTDKFGVVDYLDRIKYRSFKDTLDSCYDYIEKYIKNVDVPSIDKSYKYGNDFNLDIEKGTKINVLKKEFDKTLKEEKHFSKKINNLVSSEEVKNMEYGTRMHYILENIDFNNPDYSNINDYEKDLVENLLNNKIFFDLKNSKIYKEYEFIYEDGNDSKTGIIDLMIEHNSYIDIVDYKLKNTNDDAYIKQLNGYKKYIENKTNKKVNIYLYSLIEKTLVQLS